MRVVFGCLVLLLMVLMAGCTPNTPSVPDFSYADAAFTTTVRGAFVRTTSDGYTGESSLVGDSLTDVRQTIAARVEIGAPVAEGARGMTVTFVEPSVLAGVTVVREAGSGTVSVRWPCAHDASNDADGAAAEGASGAFTLSAVGAEYLLRFADALLPWGDVQKITPVAHGETTVERGSADGDFSAIFRFSAANGYALPVHVVVTTPQERLELFLE